MKNQQTGIIICLSVICALLAVSNFRSCNNNTPASVVKTVVKTDTIKGDTIYREIERQVPIYKTVFKDTGSTRIMLQPIDTAKILEEFYQLFYYVDTITDDTSFTAIVIDTVSQNRILNRRIFVKNIRDKAITTVYNTEVKEPKARFFVGAHLGGNQTQVASLGVDLVLATRTSNIRVSNNLLLPQPNLEIGFAKQLSFKRNN